MIFSTRARVSEDTSGRLLITRETVCVDTPAADATSLIVGRLIRTYIVIVPVIDNIIAKSETRVNRQNQSMAQPPLQGCKALGDFVIVHGNANGAATSGEHTEFAGPC